MSSSLQARCLQLSRHACKRGGGGVLLEPVYLLRRGEVVGPWLLGVGPSGAVWGSSLHLLPVDPLPSPFTSPVDVAVITVVLVVVGCNSIMLPPTTALVVEPSLPLRSVTTCSKELWVMSGYQEQEGRYTPPPPNLPSSGFEKDNGPLPSLLLSGATPCPHESLPPPHTALHNEKKMAGQQKLI